MSGKQGNCVTGEGVVEIYIGEWVAEIWAKKLKEKSQ